MDGGVAQAANLPTCNKGELAKLLEVSLPTLNKMVDDHPDFPVVARGTNGVEYEFDPVAVLEWRAAKIANEERLAQERRAAFGVLDFGAGKSSEMLPTQQLALAKVEGERRKLAREAGMLCDTATLRAKLQPVVMDLTHFLEGLPDRLGRKLKLTPAMIEEMRADLEDGRNQFVDGIEDALQPAKIEGHDLLSRVA